MGFMGGCGFLITADLHVLLGTDCTARRPPPTPPPGAKASPFGGGGCLEGSVVVQNQQADADEHIQQIQWSRPARVAVISGFIFLFPLPENQSRDTPGKAKDNRTAVREVSSGFPAEVSCRSWDCFLTFVCCLKFLLFRQSSSQV